MVTPSRETPSIGGVPWNGSIYLDAPAGLSEVDEFLWRVEHDLVWVMENLITITDKATNRPVRFALNRPQRWAMWNMVEQLATGEPSWGWYLKGRQFGYSTLFSIILFILSAMRGMNSLLLAQKEVTGKSIMLKPQLAQKSLPTLEFVEEDEGGGEGRVVQTIEVVPKPDGFQAQTLMMWLGKHLSATFRRDSAENRDAGVGETWQNGQFTEVPLWPDPAHTLGFLIPAFSRSAGTFVNGEFTARTEGDYAHKQWMLGLTPEGLFRSVFSAWYWHVPYQDPVPEGAAPFSPEEEAYRELVRVKGCEYPLTDDGRLIPRLQKVYEEKGRVEMHDLEVGFELSDEQLYFRRKQIAGFAGDLEQWKTEFPYCWREAFATAGRKLIHSTVMDQMELKASDPLPGKQGMGEYEAHQSHGGRGRARWQPRPDGRWHRFEMPQPGVTYLAFADPSSGAGVDPTGAGVLKVEYQRVSLVASFEGFLRPHDAARVLARAGRHYRSNARYDVVRREWTDRGIPAWLGIERNGFGEHLIYELDATLKYRQICRYEDRTKDNWKKGHSFGFPTTVATKKPMLLHLARGCYDEQLIVPCRRVLESLRGLQYLDDEDKLIGAPKGKHDDLGMGIGVGFWFATQLAAFRYPPVDVDPEWVVKNRAKRVLFPRAG